MSRMACKEPQCLYNTYVHLLLLTTYGLYRGSLPVQYSYTPTPQWTVRIYSASELLQYSYNSTPPMHRTACKETQWLYSTAKLLLALRTQRTLQILSACKVQLNPYNLMECTACTEPQTL